MWFKSSLLIILIISVLKAEAKEIDRDDIEVLQKNATLNALRVYAQLPDADNFLVDDAYVHLPSKFVNYSSYLLSFFSGWDEAELNRLYPKTTLVFGDLGQVIGKNGRTEASTNLRRFLRLRDDYIEETAASFRMPRFLRELIDIPTVLNCDYMLDKYNDVRFDFYLNYENYVPLKTLESDRFLCSLKGDGKVFMISEEESNNYFAAGEDEAQMKKVKYHEFELKSGQCLFIPSTWTPFLKTNYLWLYTVDWKYINKPVSYKECFPNLPPRVEVKEQKEKKEEDDDEDEDDDEEDDDEPSPMAYHRKLSQFKFVTDADQTNFEKTINYLTHFLEYLKDTQAALNQYEFVNKIKKDHKIIKQGFDCDNECNRLVKKAFLELDIDKDESFQIDDFENLDLDTALELNKKLQHDLRHMHSKDPKKDATWSFKDEEKKKGHDHDHNTEKSNAKKPYTINLGGVELPIDLEPIEKMMETFNKVKGMLESTGMMGNVKTMAFAKIKEFADKLPEDKKEKLAKVDFKELYDIFLSLTGLEDSLGLAVDLGGSKSSRAKSSGDKKKAAKKDDPVFEQHEEVKHANKYDDDDVEEIVADEDHTPKSKPKEDL